MQAIIETNDGSIQTIVGIEGRFVEWLDGWLEDHWRDTVAIWCVMDEFGEKWDPESWPAWIRGCVRRWAIHGPAGSGIIELPWTGEPWEVLMERRYPKTYALMEAFEGEPTESGPVLDDDEASLLFKEACR